MSTQHSIWYLDKSVGIPTCIHPHQYVHGYLTNYGVYVNQQLKKNRPPHNLDYSCRLSQAHIRYTTLFSFFVIRW
jgi:hypothetical protein